MDVDFVFDSKVDLGGLAISSRDVALAAAFGAITICFLLGAVSSVRIKKDKLKLDKLVQDVRADLCKSIGHIALLEKSLSVYQQLVSLNKTLRPFHDDGDDLDDFISSMMYIVGKGYERDDVSISSPSRGQCND